MTDFRVGIGCDHHCLKKSSAGEILVMGGIALSNEYYCEASSDGDVILHALCNAISTALGGGSLSKITDKMCLQQGIKDSRQYLSYFLEQAKQLGYKINNVSVAVEALKPQLEKHGEAIGESIAQLCKVEKGQVGVAFTTGEGLTACGRGEGIYAQVLVSLGGI